MSAKILDWYKAAQILGIPEHQWCNGWPDIFNACDLGILQEPENSVSQKAIQKAIEADLLEGEINRRSPNCRDIGRRLSTVNKGAGEIITDRMVTAAIMYPDQNGDDIIETVHRASSFIGWLIKNNLKPSMYVKAWESASDSSPQDKTKVLISKSRDKTESLMLIYDYLDWNGIKPGDTVTISAKQAWGEIFAGKYQSDLIKKRTGERKTARITMNGGEELDYQMFSKKYNSRLNTLDKIG
ncbi:MAG: hypothetical protein M0R33_24170 [Methylomonas sp.]|jgi:hypothetical protein|uniref:hypothetical protein n=1 Tax=Methylomonas sp. TaxID=418 RepID=UPI0025D5C4D4|nr:hypothetical protein [Methylomonas sp.]MCK9609537.1 hypothetical protein [Methylomonas sp.]